MAKYKNWGDEDDFESFHKISQKPKVVKKDKKREIKARQREREKQKIQCEWD